MRPYNVLKRVIARLTAREIPVITEPENDVEPIESPNLRAPYRLGQLSEWRALGTAPRFKIQLDRNLDGWVRLRFTLQSATAIPLTPSLKSPKSGDVDILRFGGKNHFAVYVHVMNTSRVLELAPGVVGDTFVSAILQRKATRYDLAIDAVRQHPKLIRLFIVEFLRALPILLFGDVHIFGLQLRETLRVWLSMSQKR